jgi:hypothetical protein
MSMPSTTISGTSVKVVWTLPNTHSSSIAEYDIEFLKSNAAYTTISTCLGSDVTILG